MENDDDDRALEMECLSCGLNGRAYISPVNEVTERPEGFEAKQDRGLEHTFKCLKCGVEAKLP